MAEHGLHASIWASKTSGNMHYGPRPGDWDCPACGFANYQRRTECFRCSYKGLKALSANGHELPTAPSSHNTKILEDGGSWNEAGRASSGSTHLQKEDSTLNSSMIKSGEPGLAMSRWAPRNYDGRAKAADRREVWTRTVPTVTPSESRTVTPTPPDLGLPYEVQHFILAMMQRILEEGCYEFASRWIPNKLNDKGWACSEAVELSTWKKFLPEAVPYKAISAKPNYPLEKALADAVFIRNAAVHRHLCNNVEICRMTLQAEDLMFMFSDVTRQNKFSHLREELIQWDSAVSEDLQWKRNKLESALREISERLVDDMDWTPNAVSLQEITSRPESPQPREDIDEMDID